MSEIKNISKTQRDSLLNAHKCEDYSKNPSKFWENCDPEFAHLVADKWRPPRQGIIAGHLRRLDILKQFMPGNGFKELTVIDYGIGDAMLGYVLLGQYNISKYVGIDISDRTLNVAKDTLSEFSDDSVCLVKTPVDFLHFNPDVFMSVACIQHFPNKEYLSKFLENLNTSSASVAMLYIRYGDKEEFNPEYPALACVTNAKEVMKKLTKYELKHTSSTAENGYQYLIIEKIK